MYSLQICNHYNLVLIKIDNISEYLKNNGVKPSLQRVKVFEYLYRNHNHPTVDTIYQNLKGELPTLSKTTVYNTLNLLIENKVAAVVNIDGNELRYDADMSKHGHFTCTSCGMIQDIHIDVSNLDYTSINHHKVDETHLYLKGKCNKCLTNNN